MFTFVYPNIKLKKCRGLKTQLLDWSLVLRSTITSPLLLQQLHWFPVSYRVVFKILLLVYKARHGLCPGYVSELLQERKSSRALRSSSLGLLATPTSRTNSYGDRTFSVCAPKLWNCLPNHVRNVGTLPLFKKNLKTYLFSIFVDSYYGQFLNNFH